mmetsp:Transcript_18389/g.29735  ORF Transcript_18389/g.29735 Transcript_18389/m.29735 type:complete len:233 (-) Transcript_18389:6285-6983(-)
MHKLDEHCQTQDTKHDRWHRSEVGNVHLNQIGPTVLWRKLLKIDRSCHAYGQRQEQHHQHHEQRANHRHADPRLFCAALRGICAKDKRRVEAFLHHATRQQPVDNIQMLRIDVLVTRQMFSVHTAFQVAIHAARREEPKLHRLANQRRIVDHGLTHLRCRRGRNQRFHVLGLRQRCLNTCVLNRLQNRFLNQRVIAKGRDFLDIINVAVAFLVELRLIKIHRHADKGLVKRA